MSHTAASDKTIYADYAALTPIDPTVLQALIPYYDPRYGNASSMHQFGRAAKYALEDARERIAQLIGSDATEIIFTGSGTEADNLALIGIARAHKKSGSHIIISAIEHKAVIASAVQLEAEGFTVSVLPVNAAGLVDVETLLTLIRPDTILISIMYVNNEIGTVEPVAAIAEALAEVRRGIYPLLHTDACQASALFDISVSALGVDLMTLNSTKVYGPQGVGLLYKRRGVEIEPVIVGGDQEQHLRAGTEQLPLIVGFAKALTLAQELKETEYARLEELRAYFISLLKTAIPDIIINGHPTNRTPAIVHVTVPNIEGESMLLKLDHAGIAVSTGSACSAFDLKPSHVLLAIGQDPDLVHGSIRFSIGRGTTRDDLAYITAQFAEIVSELRKISALS